MKNVIGLLFLVIRNSKHFISQIASLEIGFDWFYFFSLYFDENIEGQHNNTCTNYYTNTTTNNIYYTDYSCSCSTKYHNNFNSKTNYIGTNNYCCTINNNSETNSKFPSLHISEICLQQFFFKQFISHLILSANTKPTLWCTIIYRWNCFDHRFDCHRHCRP